MIDSTPDGKETEMPGGRSRWRQRGVLGAVCALVIGVYACTAHSGYLVSTSLNAADAYYNLLVQGFRAGHLSLKKEVPFGLARLADPYDRAANAPYGVLDLSYYKGKLYLYFGVTPVVVLFWPYVALTGHYLLQKVATVVFCLIGFLASVGLLCALWRRYFAEVSVGVVAAGGLALGLTTLTPFLLGRCDVYEVPISCGYAFTMLALAAIWKALHESRKRSGWLAAASLAYGLAVGARPSLLLGAVILLAPVLQAWRERRTVWIPLLAATGPLLLIGLALLLYNVLRFDNPFEFGWHYQMSGGRQDTVRLFGLEYLWFNFRVFFLESARWSGRFPFVHDIQAPPLPASYGGAEHPFGILTNIPLVWLALAVPLAWRGRSAAARSILCGFLAMVALLFGICALTICFCRFACTRYEVEFLPALVLLAVIGVLGLERTLAGQPVWRWAVRCGWGLLLGFSVTFNLLASVERWAEAHYDLGITLLDAHRTSEAIAHYEQALRLKPDYAEAHFNFGVALREAGRMPEAIAHWEQALRLKPDFAETHNNLAIALAGLGKLPEAVEHFEQALRTKPDDAGIHYNLGKTLKQVGKGELAIDHYEHAVRIRPDYAEAHNNLGVALMGQGRPQEAVEHWEQAVRIRPDYAEAHYNLGIAMEQMGRAQEAIGHYEQAVRINPSMAEAQKTLARLRVAQ